MNTFQPSLGFSPFANHNLFADYYLEHRLPQWTSGEAGKWYFIGYNALA